MLLVSITGSKNYLMVAIFDLDNIDSIYNKLIKANEEVALATLPKKAKSKKKPTLSETKVVEARNHLKDISSIYHAHPSKSQ